MNGGKMRPCHKTWYIDNNKLPSDTNHAQARADARVQVEAFVGTLKRELLINISECRNDRAWDCTVWYWEPINEQEQQE